MSGSKPKITKPIEVEICVLPITKKKKIDRNRPRNERSYKLSHKNFKKAFIIRSENMNMRYKDINRNLM